MKITRLFAGEDGKSQFEDFEISLDDAGEIGRLSERYPVRDLIFRENDSTYDYDWHRAPQRQYIVMLEGMVEVEAGSGEIRRKNAPR
jgi:hypothetical protein